MVNGSQIYDNSISLSKLLIDDILSMGNFRIADLGTPVNDNDAVPKLWVEQKSYSDTNKSPVRVATTSATELQNTNNSAYVYSNGSDVWTNIVNPKTIDGVTILDGDRILIKNATDGRGNGIWSYSSANMQFTRTADCSNLSVTDAVRLGITCFVNAGTANKGAGFVLISNGGSPANINGIYVLGTDTLTFNQFNGVGTLLAGNGISKVGNTISVAYDNTTIGINGNAIYVKNSGISELQIADWSVTSNKIATGSVTYEKLNANAVNDSGAIVLNGTLGNGLAVNVDGSSITIVGNQIVAPNSHTHNNLSTLDLFSDTFGILYWNNNIVKTDTQLTASITDNATTNIVVGDITQIRAIHIVFTLERNGFYSTGSIKMLHDGTDPGLETEYISLPTNTNLGINFDAAISGNDFQLVVNANSTGFDATLKYKVTTITI
jgi:hypothetical protein